MLKPDDLPGVPVELARAVISRAVTVAPCLDHLPPKDSEGDLGELRERALAVLRGVAKHAAQRGSALVRSQRIGSAGVDYGVISTAFDDDSVAALEGVCGRLCGRGPAAVTLGRFPRPGVVTDVWPELEED